MFFVIDLFIYPSWIKNMYFRPFFALFRPFFFFLSLWFLRFFSFFLSFFEDFRKNFLKVLFKIPSFSRKNLRIFRKLKHFIFLNKIQKLLTSLSFYAIIKEKYHAREWKTWPKNRFPREEKKKPSSKPLSKRFLKTDMKAPPFAAFLRRLAAR